MNFINLPYKIKKRDDLEETNIKKLLLQRESPRISGSNRLRSFFYITKSPQTEDAIKFGFPQYRNWYLQITYSGFMKIYYTQSDFTSIMYVLLFNFCGLRIKNLEELINQTEEQKLCYSQNFKQPNDDETEANNTEADCENDYEHNSEDVEEDLSKMDIDEDTEFLLPVIVIGNEKRWNHIKLNEISLCEFCGYVKYVLGESVVRLLRIPIQLAYDRAQIYFYSYKYIQKDLDYLMLSLCPSLYDILTYISFCNNLIK